MPGELYFVGKQRKIKYIADPYGYKSRNAYANALCFPSTCRVMWFTWMRREDVLSCYVYSMLFDVLLSVHVAYYGSLFFALVMVPHDVCYSIENIGYNVVRTDPVTFCNNSLSEYNKETQNCEDIPFPEMTNKTVTMNVVGAYKEIFGEWDGSAVNTIYDSYAYAAVTLLPHRLIRQSTQKIRKKRRVFKANA